MHTDPDPHAAMPPGPSDTFLAMAIDDIEREGEVALQRLARQHPVAERQVRRLIHGLARTGLLRQQQQCGRFRLERRIGNGSMGEVWQATDPQLGREVAIKTIVAHLCGNERAAQRFAREARAVARLRHPSVVTIYEVGEHAGAPFLVMELIDGGSLHALLGGDCSRTERRRLTEVEACALGSDLCSALQAAHDLGIVHRDVKPANVLVRASGAALLSDFGLARCRDDATATATGDFVGTPAYSPPEVFLGGQPTAGGDVYSLAATLYECVTGELPGTGGNPAGASATVRRARNWRELGAAVSVDFACVLLKALDEDPSGRYATAAELGADLDRVRRGEPVRARRVGWLHRLWRAAKLRPALAVAIVAPLVLIAASVTVVLRLQSSALHRYAQLADTRVIVQLQEEVGELWPADLPIVPRIERWLAQADAVLARASAHAAERDRLAALGRQEEGGRVVFTDDQATIAWHHSVLADLCVAAAKFGPVADSMRLRLGVARTLREVTLDGVEAQQRWATACAAIKNSPRYGGLDLRPQLGLLPLCENEAGLWEFWHVVSGARPEPAPAGSKSRWLIRPETGMVFILVPGGRQLVGSYPPSESRPLGTPHVSTVGSKSRLIAAFVTLHPYFLSKYEATQAQYQRLTGTKPSHFDPERIQGYSVTCPCESVSWETLMVRLPPTRLCLPTDAQWEVAYRAGSTTRFPMGDTVETMYGLDNVVDLTWKEDSGGPIANVDPFRDGHVGTCPVDVFGPNALGFHGMLGNVAEICRDSLGRLLPRRDGDGLIEGRTRFAALRGVSWAESCSRAESGFTDLLAIDKDRNMAGFRPLLEVR